MLGSVAEAEDIAQETLLRVSALETPPDEPAAWVTTVATRLSSDHLRLARVRRETYVGPWLPEPLVIDGSRARTRRAELPPARRPRPQARGGRADALRSRPRAATEPVTGADAVARFMAEITRARRTLGEFAVQWVTVNGQPGEILRDGGEAVWDVLAIDVVDGRIEAVRIVRNPDKPRHP